MTLKTNSPFLTVKLNLIITLLFLLGCNGVNSNSEQSPAGNSTIQSKATPKSESSLSPSEEKITKQEFGETWAFTVGEGILSCKGSNEIGEVYFTVKGKTYAVNGSAKALKKYPPIDEIWTADPSIPGAKKNINSFIEKGLNLCQ